MARLFRRAGSLICLGLSLLLLACGGDSEPEEVTTSLPAVPSPSRPAPLPTPQPTTLPGITIGADNVAKLKPVVTTSVGNVGSLVWQRDSTSLLAYSSTQVVAIDAATLQQQIVFAPVGATVFSVSDTGFVAMGPLPQGPITVHRLGPPGAMIKTVHPAAPFSTAVLSQDGSLLAVAAANQIAVELWDVEQQEQIKLLAGFQTAAPVYGARFTPDGRGLVWLSRARIQLMDIASGRLGPPLEHQDFVFGLVMTADARTLVTATGGALTLWDAASGAKRGTMTPAGIVSAVALSPDERLLAAAGDQGISFWDLSTLKQVGSLPGDAVRSSTVRLVAFSPDGRTFTSSDDKGDVTVWRLP